MRKPEKKNKCPKCDADILCVVTKDGKITPVDAKKVKVAMLMDMGGILKIEETISGHQSHVLTCEKP